MLELRPGCEQCDRDLPADSADAWICSFECTFCARCAHEHCAGRCPNCGGELVRRPRRPAAKLHRHPASTTRVYRPVPDDGTPRAAPDASMPAPEPTEGTKAGRSAAATRTPPPETTSSAH